MMSAWVYNMKLFVSRELKNYCQIDFEEVTGLGSFSFDERDVISPELEILCD